MLGAMKKFVIAGLVVVGLIVSLVLAFSLYLNSLATTECYADFPSRGATTSAASAARDAGLEANVEELDSDWGITFESDKTGGGAREHIQTFHEIVKRERGTLAHPGDGCLERAPFGN